MLGFGGLTQSMTVDEATAEWGEGPAEDTMGTGQPRPRQARKGGVGAEAGGARVDRGD